MAYCDKVFLCHVDKCFHCTDKSLTSFITMKKCIVVFILFLAVTCNAEPRIRPESWAKPIIETGLENFYVVDEGVYRSEQPHRKDIDDIEALGIEEILSLREFHGDGDDLGENRLALHRVKMNAGHITEEQIIKALRIIVKRKGPILIHCWHGSDRTGTVVAAYRIAVNHWSKDQALDEMIHGGYGYHRKIYPGLVDFVKSLDISRIQQSLQ